MLRFFKWRINVTTNRVQRQIQKNVNNLKPGCFLINTSRGEIWDENVICKALENSLIAGIATDVLANEYSASASEILVGAVQDTNRGKVVGDTTFGKGSVSILRPLSNGAGLYITVAHWYTPAGRLIHEEGLDPDIEVSGITDRRELESEQTNMAIQILQQELKSSQR